MALNFVEHKLAPAAARTFLRRLRLEGRAVYLVVAQNPYTTDGQLAKVAGSVEVSKSAAIDYIRQAYENDANLVVRIAAGDYCVMVGRA